MNQVKIDLNKFKGLMERHGRPTADRMSAYREALLSGPQATLRFIKNQHLSNVSITLLESKLKDEDLWPL